MLLISKKIGDKRLTLIFANSTELGYIRFAYSTMNAPKDSQTDAKTLDSMWIFDLLMHK
jgi:hypothetical protein